MRPAGLPAGGPRRAASGAALRAASRAARGELLNLKQRQVLTASQLALRNFSTSCSHASSALDLLQEYGYLA